MKTAMVTGATDGHGRYVALGLASRGWRVVVHGRSSERAEAVVAEASGDGHEVRLADFASLASVRSLVDTLDDVQLIVANAGIISHTREESADGAELTFAVNHLAHVALCEELVARDVGVERIVSVSSIGQAPFDWDDPMLERSYEPWQAYMQSKLAQVCWTFDLAPIWSRRGITMDALHPATFMDTGMVRSGGISPHNTVADGGDATLALIEDDSATGRFFDGRTEARANDAAYDADERERIHQLTARFL
jgi:NAD(P)-dependent dehydrogenase (short-subunit alcohol dehydrogenase family)